MGAFERDCRAKAPTCEVCGGEPRVRDNDFAYVCPDCGTQSGYVQSVDDDHVRRELENNPRSRSDPYRQGPRGWNVSGPRDYKPRKHVQYSQAAKDAAKLQIDSWLDDEGQDELSLRQRAKLLPIAHQLGYPADVIERLRLPRTRPRKYSN